MSYKDVPLMFQAQLQGRCQLQRVIGDKHAAYVWQEQWTACYPQPKTQIKPPLKAAKPSPQDVFARGPRPTAPASSASNGESKAQDFLKQPPQFGKRGENVQTQDYRVSWRLVSNCGQDEGFIRPIIGAKGYPYFSGSSMKGAFRRACSTPDLTMRYCGGTIVEDGIKQTKPGILRFHGGYPTDTSWTKQMVDVVHSQEQKQVKRDASASANAAISLYRVVFRFGISSTGEEKLTEADWQEIWTIWDNAVACGLGSRVSAGYGRMEKVGSKVDSKVDSSAQVLFPKEQELVKVSLSGEGLAAILLDKKTSEFRPNMFKAALRGHTLRLFGGMTDAKTAEYLTKLLWGGFRAGYRGQEARWDNGGSAIEGLLSVGFECPAGVLLEKQEYNQKDKSGQAKLKYTDVFKCEAGILRICAAQRQQPVSNSDLAKVAEAVVRFAMLLGGFGKSWRRIDHRKFYDSHYTQRKPTIGCHWTFIEGSESFYVPANALQDIGTYIDKVVEVLRQWAAGQIRLGKGVSDWREAWYRHSSEGGVQVWGRIAKKGESLAVDWFHKPFNGKDSIKRTSLTGWIGKPSQTGRIWHRMYPCYETDSRGDLIPSKGYVELLTIFPDEEKITEKFLQFLEDTEFERIW